MLNWVNLLEFNPPAFALMQIFTHSNISSIAPLLSVQYSNYSRVTHFYFMPTLLTSQYPSHICMIYLAISFLITLFYCLTAVVLFIALLSNFQYDIGNYYE